MTAVSPFRWRYVLLCGVLWGCVSSVAETTALPMSEVDSGYILQFLLQVSMTRVPDSILWAAGAKWVEDKGHPLLILLLVIPAGWALSVGANIVWRMTMPIAPDGMAGLLTNVPIVDLLTYLGWSNLFFGLIYVVGYLSARRAGRMRAGLAEIRRQRSEADSALREAQLAAMRSQLQPELLIEALTVLRDLYAQDRAAGDRLFDRLVAFLRAAMPGIRSGQSTLQAELSALNSYVALHAMLDRPTALRIEALAPAVEDVPFSPLALLPLLDSINGALRPGSALTIGSSRIADGYHIAIRAEGEGSDGLAGLGPSFEETFGALGARLSVAPSPRRCDIDIRVPLGAAASSQALLAREGAA